MHSPYRLFVVDRWGHPLDRDGSPHDSASGRPPLQQEFADLEAARQFAEAVVQEHPHAECDVFCGDRLVLQHFDPAWRAAEEEQSQSFFAQQSRRDRLIISAIIGGALLLLVGVLLFLCR
jgi:hypothetical protein